jgi:hypothetical protein
MSRPPGLFRSSSALGDECRARVTRGDDRCRARAQPESGPAVQGREGSARQQRAGRRPAAPVSLGYPRFGRRRKLSGVQRLTPRPRHRPLRAGPLGLAASDRDLRAPRSVVEVERATCRGRTRPFCGGEGFRRGHRRAQLGPRSFAAGRPGLRPVRGREDRRQVQHWQVFPARDDHVRQRAEPDGAGDAASPGTIATCRVGACRQISMALRRTTSST